MSKRDQSTLWIVVAGLVLAAYVLAPKPPQPKPQPAPPAQAHALPADQISDIAPEDLPQDGFVPQFGYKPNPPETRAFVGSLPRQTYFEWKAAAVPEVGGDSPKKEPVLLYRALYAASPGWGVGRQGIGDCVSWGWAHGVDIVSAVDFKLGKNGVWKPVATEPIYGGSRVQARGGQPAGYSDGSYGGAAAKWVRDWGVLYREAYPGNDLSSYSSNRAKQWGNSGCPRELEPAARQHPVKTVALVTSFEEAAHAIENGYPVAVCSGQGFASRRDNQGFAAASGSWPHCMCFWGVRYDRPGLLCMNSWGPHWISGPKVPIDQPEGSFWVDASVCTSMLRGRDSFALSSYVGFPPRKLRHAEGWGLLNGQRAIMDRIAGFDERHTFPVGSGWFYGELMRGAVNVGSYADQVRTSGDGVYQRLMLSPWQQN